MMFNLSNIRHQLTRQDELHEGEDVVQAPSGLAKRKVRGPEWSTLTKVMLFQKMLVAGFHTIAGSQADAEDHVSWDDKRVASRMEEEDGATNSFRDSEAATEGSEPRTGLIWRT